MIPTLLLVGLVFGKWWRVVIPVATVGWVVVLLATDTGSGTAFAASAALIGAINIAVGALVNEALRASLHQVFRHRRSPGHSW